MKINEMILDEGINDKYIFKAILTSGSPGSGKSTVSRKLLSHYGFRTVNIDNFIEHLGRKQNLDFRDMTDWNQQIFDRSSDLRNISMDLYIQGRLPLTIDGTGRNYTKITSTAEILKKKYGYDVGLLFVNVSLETAKQRNIKRGEESGRQVDDEFLTKAWQDTQNNIGKFQDYFQNNMFIVDNNDSSDYTNVQKRVDKFINSPVNNPMAKKWTEQEKKKRNLEPA